MTLITTPYFYDLQFINKKHTKCNRYERLRRVGFSKSEIEALTTGFVSSLSNKKKTTGARRV